MEIVLKNQCLLPTSKLDDQKFEFIFLLDVSSSMAGESIELAKRALTLFLHSLPSSCYFNVITFNHAYKMMFPQSVKYNQQTLEQAKLIVSQMRGTGCTAIYEPFQAVYAQNQIPGYLTQIFALTDGQVPRQDEVFQIVKSHVKHSRSFALGIGNGVSRELVQGIADCGGGTAEFVTHDEEIQAKVLYQLKISMRPALLKPIRVSA